MADVPGGPCSGGRYERVARATVEAMHARGRDPLSVSGSSRCDRCGALGDYDGARVDADEVELFCMITPRGGLVQVCDTCGDLCRCTRTPPCEGAADLCGAPAGKPCEPGCPSRTADPCPPDRAHGA